MFGKKNFNLFCRFFPLPKSNYCSYNSSWIHYRNPKNRSRCFNAFKKFGRKTSHPDNFIYHLQCKETTSRKLFNVSQIKLTNVFLLEFFIWQKKIMWKIFWSGSSFPLSEHFPPISQKINVPLQVTLGIFNFSAADVLEFCSRESLTDSKVGKWKMENVLRVL